MLSPENRNGFTLTKKETAQAVNYLGKKDGKTNFHLNLDHIDSFSMGWQTSLTIEDFLAQACSLADKVALLDPECRPMETEQEVTIVKMRVDATKGVATGRISAAPSYSGFNYNTINIGSPKGYTELTFDEAGWPITKMSLQKVIDADGHHFELDDRCFIRINAEFCTIMFNGEQPLVFSFWSHVPAIEALTDSFSRTSTQPELTDQFRDATNILASPRFAPYLPAESS